ncbi:MAG: DEAD/DEAH box helicase [Planctomycetes bacterium]|nr:DEAD/DEAH box helicase [Planctomycetota bacterium]
MESALESERTDAASPAAPPDDAAAPGLAGTPADLLPALQRRGFQSLTEVQRAVLAADDGAADLRITSRTGSGKTVALGFALAPGLIGGARRGPCTLVIAPTRELAMQVKEELGWLFADLPHGDCAVVTGGTSLVRERRELQRRPAVLVGTPGRLLDHVREGVLDLSAVTQLVLDEADQMLDLGFKDELDGILEHLPSARRTHLVSATFPDAVLALADRFQRTPVFVEGAAGGAAHADIEHVVHRIGAREHYAALVNLLLLAGDARTLLFVRTRENTVSLADKLAADGFAAMPIHGDLAQAQRTRTLESFRRGTVRALVATDVAARGLDIPAVTAVVHVHPPIDSATYVHRSGRTGRAGRKGRSILLATKNVEARARRLFREAGIRPQLLPVPGPDEVEACLLERATAAATAAIDAGGTPRPDRRAAAERLLQGRDPAAVVAALLAQSLTQTRAPIALADQPPAPRVQPPRAEAPRGQRLPPERRGEPGAPPSWRRERPAAEAAFARFRINWGLRDGADARRILAHVCRRGDIDSRLVGNIALAPGSSTFEVAESIAASFARRVQKRDRRDPHLFIVPADGGA